MSKELKTFERKDNFLYKSYVMLSTVNHKSLITKNHNILNTYIGNILTDIISI